MNFEGFAVAQSVYPPGMRLPRHSHDYSNVSIVLAGQIEEGTEYGKYCGRASSVVMKPAGCEHDNVVSGFGAKTLSIRFALQSPLARIVEGSRWRWFDGPPIVRRAIDVQRAFSSGCDVDRSAVALVEAVVAAAKTSAEAPAWVVALRALIEEHAGESLRFESLARDFGLHPVYASRAFRRHVGLSMTEYLRSIRLRNARCFLASTRRSVAAIAQECGFADASHLCRTFARFHGVTPQQYRNLGRG